MAVSNEWKNQRNFLRKTHNKEVNEWFRDIDDPIPDNSTPRKQAKKACLIRASDSQNMALLKIHSFMYVVQRVQHKPNIFGVPIGTVNAQRKYRPQIVLEFLEDEFDVENTYERVEGRISFRLMNETSESISRTELRTMATKIKTEFGASNGYIWKKGKDLASYTDWDKGYQLQLYVRNKTDAKAIINKVLDIQGHTPNWSKLYYKENDDPIDAYPTVPPSINILGETKREPRIRPIASVRFQYAYCSIWGKPRPVILYDRSYRYLDTLIDR